MGYGGRPTVITHAELDKLRCILAPHESVLSLYLEVPRDPASLRELPARAHDLITAAADGTDACLSPEDEEAACGLVRAHAREWLGHTVAIFVCRELGLLEVVPLPDGVGERAVLAVRPHVRPLLAALQRHPDHRIVIIDSRHAWLLAVVEDRVETVAAAPAPTMPSSGFGGWYGLESYHVERRVTELARHHYRDAAWILERAARDGGAQPFVIGGHAGGIKHLLSALPGGIRESYAGCFAADPHTLTPARASELAAPVISQWASRTERRAIEQVAGQASDARAIIGLNGCLAAVNADAVDLLLIPDEGVVPGYRCERCGVLSVTGKECCDWGAASRAVPDLLEEMALQTLHEGGDVISVHQLPCGAAARLRPAGR
jgi:Bacterial archaeo-eukaryotic release factor family 10